MQIAKGIVDRLAQALSHLGRLDEGADQHVVGELGRGPGVGEGEIEPEIAKALLIVGMNHLQVSQGVGNAVIAVAGAGRLERIQRHPGAAIADAVHVDAEARLVEGADVALQIRIPVVDDAVAAGVLAVGGDGDLGTVGIHGQMGAVVVLQHAGIGQEDRVREGIPFDHAIEEDLDRVGLDQRILGEALPDFFGLGQVACEIELAAVVVLVEAGGGGDAHVQQILRLHVEQSLADEVGGAGILYPGDAARGHQLGDGGQDLVVLGGGLIAAGAQHTAVGHRNGAAGRVPDHPAGQVHIGNELSEHAARRQGGGVEADDIAILVLGQRQRPGVVGTGVAVDPGQHHRIVRCHGIQGRQQGGIARGWGVAIVGGPLIDHQPVAGLGRITGQALLDLGGQLVQIDALAVEIAHVQRHGAEQVDVVVVQARQHHLAVQIHHLGGAGLEGLGPLAGAHVSKLAVADHHGLGLAALPVLGVDLAVEIERIFLRGLTAVLLAAEQAAHQQGGDTQPESGLFAIHCMLSLSELQFLLHI
ncbi:hypothetical protein D3C79_559220 [compost metagenome]